MKSSSGSPPYRTDVRAHAACGNALAVVHQPGGGSGNQTPHDDTDKAERGAGTIREPPAEIGADQLRIEQHDRDARTDRGADPEAAVDDKISPAAITRRRQFLDRRIDRGVFAADAGTGEESKQRIARDIPR